MLHRKDVAGFDAWSAPLETLFAKFETTQTGVPEPEVYHRLHEFGYNEVTPKKKRNLLLQFLLKFLNPLSLVLLTVGTASFFLDNQLSAVIIYFMVLISATMTFYQEYTAQDAAEKLRKLIRNTATVVREGIRKEVPLKSLVPGDWVRLSSGDLVPADCRIVSCKDFFLNQASLTGESLPVEKTNEPAPQGADTNNLRNVLYFGSSVVSGSAEAMVVHTGKDTQFGELARRLSLSGAETAFDRGIRDYSMLMIKFVFVLAFSIFLINAFLKHDFISSFMFALAVAVGLTPEMLPVIVTANLAQGANEMAKKEAIVKRLPSIQNLGAMDVLCTDKTGTLTADHIELVKYVNISGKEDGEVLALAYLNSYHQTGLRNPLDNAVLEHALSDIHRDLGKYKKVDEIPFDFIRRRMSVVVETPEGRHLMLTKGAPESTLEVCTRVSRSGKSVVLDKKYSEAINKLYDQLSADGFRVLALASKRTPKEKPTYGIADEKEMMFQGFLAFLDPPKPTAHASLLELMKRGISIKILSGDNLLVNQKVARDVGLEITGILSGADIEAASDESLQVLAEKNNIFVRVSPIQKERIIIALQRNRHVVGFLGDGINDSLALKTSDVGISVDSAVDVARESADIILLRKSLHVLYEGVDEGRRTFLNTLKYLKMGSSSNFGNMFSVVGASVFLPFLPMAPIQIILNNFLYDLSQLGIPTDHVDPELLAQPVQWKMDLIRNFMIFMGPVSSIFDYLTFGLLFLVLKAPPAVFHTGWFLESILTQTVVIHVIRTNRIPFLQSVSSKRLLGLSIFVVLAALAIVATPLRALFGFGELPAIFYPLLVGIVLAYMGLAQLVKVMLLRFKVI